MAELPYSTSSIRQEVKIRMGKAGSSAIPPKTILQCFDETVKRIGNEPALFQKRPVKDKDWAKIPWTTWTWKEYRKNVDAFGKSLISLGFQRFDVINIIGFNAPEWFFANYGAIAAGGVSAGIYTTNLPDACKYISEHSRARVVVCDGLKQLEKYYEISKVLPCLEALVMYGPDNLPHDIKSRVSVPVYTFDEFLKLGSNISDAELKIRSDRWKPNEVCELIYTSGTTGPPKAVMITHDNITFTVRTVVAATRKGYVDHNDVMVSYLPLSHVAAQTLDLFQPLETGCKIYFARPDALKGSLVETLRDVRPTVFFGVPRVWEKIYERMQEVAKSSSDAQKMVSSWAKSEAAAYWDSMSYTGMREMNAVCSFPVGYYMAKFVLALIHQKLGFDRCTEFYVAAAPMDIKILRYFHSLDIPIMEIFGQSECTGPHTVNTYTAFKLGTVGRPLPGTETRIDPDTGELCYRGRHIFAGYMGMPEKTKETIDSDGWLHSGDIATIDNDNDDQVEGTSGFITITGRIKELIITAGGENVPPVLIETEIKHAMPAIANAMIIGDKRKFLTVLLCLHVEVDEEGWPSTKLSGLSLDIGKDIGSVAKTTKEARADPKWQMYFDNGIKKANEKATSRAQAIGKWALLDTNFSEKGGELTPTMKLKRAVTAEKYADVIESLYD